MPSETSLYFHVYLRAVFMLFSRVDFVVVAAGYASVYKLRLSRLGACFIFQIK